MPRVHVDSCIRTSVGSTPTEENAVSAYRVPPVYHGGSLSRRIMSNVQHAAHLVASRERKRMRRSMVQIARLTGDLPQSPLRTWSLRLLRMAVGFAIALPVLGGIILTLLYYNLIIPEPKDIAFGTESTVYYSDATTPIATFAPTQRTLINTQELPEHVSRAVIAARDPQFFDRQGVTLSSFFDVLRGKHHELDGEELTITRSYVERYYSEEPSNYITRIETALLVVKADNDVPRETMAGHFLNTAYFGRGAYGIEAAAQAYFEHSAQELTLPESVLLGALVTAPSRLDPSRAPEAAREKWLATLETMQEQGWISARSLADLKFPDVVTSYERSNPTWGNTLGYLMDAARTELYADHLLEGEMIEAGGLSIVTSLDENAQHAAVAAGKKMNSVNGWDPAEHRMALTAVSPDTGRIVALYGGADYHASPANTATQVTVPAGPTFSTFGLLANARAGGSVEDVYPASAPATIAGVPTPIANEGEVSENSATLTQAAQHSLHTALVNMNVRIGTDATQAAVSDGGMLDYAVGIDVGPLNVLGQTQVRNIDIARGYTTLAAGGAFRPIYLVEKATAPNGEDVYAASRMHAQGEQVFSAEDLSAVMPALENNLSHSAPVAKVRNAGMKVVGMTGATYGHASAQFVAMSPHMVTAVTMYRVDSAGALMPLTPIGGRTQFWGSDWPAEVWANFVSALPTPSSPQEFSWVVPVNRAAGNYMPVAPVAPAPEPPIPLDTSDDFDTTIDTPSVEVPEDVVVPQPAPEPPPDDPPQNPPPVDPGPVIPPTEPEEPQPQPQPQPDPVEQPEAP